MIIKNPIVVELAHRRLVSWVKRTPILYSDILNTKLGHNIYFKADCLQYTGAFKIRGILNHLLILTEQNLLPQHVVTYSTGNHGIGLAWASRQLHIQARVYLPQNVSVIKQKICKFYGAEVIVTATRQEAEDRAQQDINYGYYYLPPSDHDDTIAGCGTLCYEALQDVDKKIDAIFAACGGGGLLSGTYLAKNLLSPSTKVFGVEPYTANDAFLSLQQGTIYKFHSSPETIADALRALNISQRTFNYIQKLDDIFLVEEEDIVRWTIILLDLLKITCEPSSAISMAAAAKWLETQTSPQHVLILISGGNIDYSNLFKAAGTNFINNIIND